MTEEVTLLKHGKPVKYLRCDCCGHYSRGVSARGWCYPCEQQFLEVKATNQKRKPPCQ